MVRILRRLALLGMLLLLWHPAAVAMALPVEEHYSCDGDPLVAVVHAGAVDAMDIPNSVAGTVPGAYVVIIWRGIKLQLPRTNNAGAPSFTDGRWWWQAEDSEHPAFAQRRGSVERYSCSRLSQAE